MGRIFMEDVGVSSEQQRDDGQPGGRAGGPATNRGIHPNIWTKAEKYLCCVNTSGAWQLLATQSSPDDRSGCYQPNISCPSAAPPYQPL